MKSNFFWDAKNYDSSVQFSSDIMIKLDISKFNRVLVA